MPLVEVLAVLCAATLLQMLKLRWKSQKKAHPFPPGPKRVPVIGNFFDLSHDNRWEAARQWGRKYGPFVFVENLGIPILFLNSYDAIVELFDKRGNIYSSRPASVMFELAGWSKWAVTLLPYGDRLRESRRLMYRYLQVSVVPDYYSIQEASAHKLLQNLSVSPQDFRVHTRMFASRSILKITYGYDILDTNDPYVAIAERGNRNFSETEGFFLVNLFPWLRHLPSWFPGTDFQKISSDGRVVCDEMRNKPYAWAKREIMNGKANNSMIGKLLGSLMSDDGTVVDEEIIKNVAGSIYGAGTDTIVSVCGTFILAMVLHPDVMKRGQEELDRVLGKNILPTMKDQAQLPYITAIQKECLRWQTVVPLGVAHSASEDDIYDEYFVPRDTIVYSNLWAASRDSNLYYRPDEFIPERWLPGPEEKPPLDIDRIGFGIGRRICPGRHIASNTIFIFIASVLSAFDIEKANLDDGTPITPKVEYLESFVRHPKPFQCAIKPRSKEIATLVLQAVESESL